jgi:hypothetical protein
MPICMHPLPPLPPLLLQPTTHHPPPTTDSYIHIFTYSHTDSRERLVLAGGYGGFPAVEPHAELYDGFITRADTWESYDGFNWTQLNWNNTFQGRAWFGMDVHHDLDPRMQFPRRNESFPPKM